MSAASAWRIFKERFPGGALWPRLSWTRRGFGLTSAVRYVPSYDDVAFLGGRNGRKVAAQAIVDVQVSVDLGKIAGEQSPWNGFEIRAGAFNLFDAEPPFAEVALFCGLRHYAGRPEAALRLRENRKKVLRVSSIGACARG